MTRYGIFTDRQREYLCGELDDLDSGDERALRGKIRRRIDTAYAEFTLFTKVDEQDRQQIFEEQLAYTEDDPLVKGGAAEAGFMKRDKEQWETGGGIGLAIGFGHLFRFTYLGLREQGLDADHFAQFIKLPIADAECDLNDQLRRGDVTVTFDVETVADVDIEAAKAKHEAGEELSAAELKALVDHGHLIVHGG